MNMPGIKDLEIYRGDDYVHEFRFVKDDAPDEPLNLIDYSFQAEIRDRPENGRLLVEFTVDTTDANVGIIVISLSREQSRVPPGYWDLQVNNGTMLQTWLKGKVIMSGDVTQEVSL